MAALFGQLDIGWYEIRLAIEKGNFRAEANLWMLFVVDLVLLWGSSDGMERKYTSQEERQALIEVEKTFCNNQHCIVFTEHHESIQLSMNHREST